jgi:NDP-hexose 4-ketoreductase
MMPRRALLTGATGFIGRWVARALAARGDIVYAIARAASTRQDLSSILPGAVWLDANIFDSGSLFRAVKAAEPDIIFHLAGRRVGSLEELEAVNVGGMENILRAVARGTHAEPPVRVIAAGSAAEYGATPESELPIREESAPAPVSDYGLSKLEATERAIELAETLGVPVVIARIFNVTGPGEPDSLVFGRLAQGIARAEREARSAEILVGPLGATRDLIDVRDVALALLKIGDAPGVGAAAGGAAHALDPSAGAPAGEAASPAGGATIVNVARGVEENVREHAGRILAHARVPAHAIEPEGEAPKPPSRHVADVRRLASTGFRADITLEESALDLLEEARSRLP